MPDSLHVWLFQVQILEARSNCERRCYNRNCINAHNQYVKFSIIFRWGQIYLSELHQTERLKVDHIALNTHNPNLFWSLMACFLGTHPVLQWGGSLEHAPLQPSTVAFCSAPSELLGSFPLKLRCELSMWCYFFFFSPYQLTYQGRWKKWTKKS